MTKKLLSVTAAVLILLMSLSGCTSCGNNNTGQSLIKPKLAVTAAINPFEDLIKGDSSSKNSSASSYSSSSSYSSGYSFEDAVGQMLDTTSYDYEDYYSSSSVATSQPEPIEEPVMMEYSKATGFSEGYAWVLSKEKSTWSIIDVKGSIVKTFTNDDIYEVVQNFTNGYSIVKCSSSFMIINTKGEIVLNGKEKGYESLYNYDGLKDGSIIAIKNLDDFEKSGDYYYHYNLLNNTETELGATRDEHFHYYFYYAGKGYYVITNNENGYTYNSNSFALNIVFSNYMNNSSFDLTKSKPVKETLSSARNPEIQSWTVRRVGDYVSLSIKPRSGSAVGFKVDLDNKKCSAVKDLNGYKLSDYYTLDFVINDSYGNIGIIKDSGVFLYDFEKNKGTKFEPKTDYECSFISMQKTRSLVTTRNSNGTLFYSVVGWDMKPLFAPQKYDDADVFLDDYMVTQDEESGVSITNVAKGNEVVKNISDASIDYVDVKNKCVWVKTSTGLDCYNISDGELKCSLKGACKVENVIDSDIVLAAYEDSYSYSYDYYNMNGEKLEVQEDVVYKYAESSASSAASSPYYTSSAASYSSATSTYSSPYFGYSSEKKSTGEDHAKSSPFSEPSKGSVSLDDPDGILDSLFNELMDYDIYELLCDLVKKSTTVARGICYTMLVIGIIGCFFGFKLTKFMLGLCGFLAGGLTGGLIGIAAAIIKNSEDYLTLGLVLSLVLSIVFMILSYKMYKFGVFVMTFVNGFNSGFLLGSLVFDNMKVNIAIGIIVGLITGILSVVFTKATIIISTSISFGDICGVSLGLLLTNPTMCRLLPLVFMIAGVLVQRYTNGGLLEGAAQNVVNNHK